MISITIIVTLLFPAAIAAPVPLIIDTDIGGGGCKDVDDVAAVCMAHALAGIDHILDAFQRSFTPRACEAANGGRTSRCHWQWPMQI